MKKRLLLAALITSMYQYAGYANELLVLPRIELGVSDYTVETSLDLPPGDGAVIPVKSKLNDNLMIYKLGVTLALSDYYIDVLYSGSGDFNDSTSFPQLGIAEDWSGDRTEVNLTVGYQLFDSGSIFVGYRDAELEANGSIGSSFNYQNDGLFLGVNYGIPVGDSGTVAFNIAYSFIDGTLNGQFGDLPLARSTGDSGGIKYGVSWNGNLTSSVFYSVSADRYSYSTDLTASSEQRFTMDESETALRFVLKTVF